MQDPSAEDIYLDESPDSARNTLLGRAAKGDHDAEFYLGHLADEASPPDQAAALNWYRKAANGGHLEAAHMAASFVYFGMGTEQDVATAVEAFRTCARAGLDASQWKLGQHLLSIPNHRAEALEWLQLAAAQGHSGAIELLASESTTK